MTALRVDLDFGRISCLCTMAGLLLFFFCACVDKPDVTTTYKSFRLNVVSTGQLAEKPTDPLPKEVIELALPLRSPQNCPDAAFFAQVDLTRIDIEPVGSGKATLVTLDPDSLEKDAQERLSVAKRFVGKKPDFNIMRSLALQKLMNQNSGDVAAIAGNRDVQITADLKNVFEKTREARVFLSPSFSGVEKDKLAQELQLTMVADEKDLSELMAKELCDRWRNAGQKSTALNIIVLYKSPLEKGSIRLGNSVSQKKVPSDSERPPETETASGMEPPLEAKQHMQQGMTYVSLAKKNPAAASENYENALTEFSLAAELYPNYAEAYSNRGVVYMQQKKFNKALEDLEGAAELKPKDPTIRYNLAALHSLQNKIDLSLDELDKALEYGFNNYDALKPSGPNSDADLKNLRKDAEFRKVLDKHKIFILK